MTKKLIYIFLLSIFIFSCKYQHQNTEKIIFRTNYVIDKGWIKLDTIIYSINRNGDFIDHIYKEQNDIIKIFRFFANDTTKMIYAGDTCPMIDCKEFCINDTIFKIRKFEYDIEHSYDEECSIFYVDNYGVISIKSEAWAPLSSFYDVANTELLGVLKRDTTGFYWK